MLRKLGTFLAGLFLAACATAAPISTYPAASTLTGTEKLLCTQAGATKNCTPAQIATYTGTAAPAGGGVSVMQYGAVADDNGTTGTNNLSAFNAAIAYACAHTVAGGYGYGAGPMVSAPIGRFYLGGTLTIPCAIKFSGSGIGGIGNGATQLRFPANTPGVVWADTAFNFIMEGFYVNSTAGAVNLAYPGIWAQSKGTIRDTTVSGFSGPCIYEQGNSGFNVNSWRIDEVMTYGCSHSGVYVIGGDGNAGLATGLQTNGNGRYGFEDNSFLGNEWHLKDSSTNTLGAYWTASAAQASTISGYTEPDQPAAVTSANAISIGGNQFAGVTGGALIRGNGFDGGGLYSQGGYGTRNGDAVTGDNAHIQISVGANEGGTRSSALWSGEYTNDGGATYSGLLRARVRGDGGWLGNNPLAFFQGTFGVNSLFFQSSDVAKGTWNFGRTNPVPYAINITGGFFPGLGNDGRQLDFRAAAPTSGEYARGDLFLNNAPSLGGVFGWTTTTAGATATSAWAGSTAYTKGLLVLNDTGKTYVNITAGTSASSGGPTGTAADITDGTAHWKYLAAPAFAADYVYPRADPTTGIGYVTGAGGAVTQGTSRTTGVTLSKVTGAITLFSAAGSATPFTFTVTNTTVAANDNVVLNVQAAATDHYRCYAEPAAGSFDVTCTDETGTATEAPVINFSVIKAVAA